MPLDLNLDFGHLHLYLKDPRQLMYFVGLPVIFCKIKLIVKFDIIENIFRSKNLNLGKLRYIGKSPYFDTIAHKQRKRKKYKTQNIEEYKLLAPN